MVVQGLTIVPVKPLMHDMQCPCMCVCVCVCVCGVCEGETIKREEL